MRPTVFSRIALLAFVVLLGYGAAASQGQKFKRPFVSDEILVKLREGTTKKRANEVLARLSVSRQEPLGDLGWVRVKVSKGRDPRSAAAEILQQADVEAAQPNYYYKLLDTTPNDPLWSSSGMYGLLRISAPAAWDVTTGSSTVVVANIDTGIRYTHEDLAPNMWVNPGEVNGNGIDDDGNGFVDDYYGYDFFYNDSDPVDEHGHGTHTAGTIGAAGNNALGVVGVNWNVKIMAIKIFNGAGTDTTSAMLINAYNYVRMMKNRGVNIRVTNNSYSGCDEACGDDFATKDALDAMGEAGILNVFAAGNNGQNNDTAAAPNLPASYTSPSILAVASSTSTDTRSSFSAYGANSVDIAAPGSVILSTTNGSNSSYGIMSGTSMAAPHVAGAAALLAAFNPSLSTASIKATLLNTVDTFTSLGTTVQQNWSATPVRSGGRLNIARALQSPTVCTFELSGNAIRVRTKGGYYSFGVTAGQNCDFAVKSSVRWVLVEGGEAHTGSGQILIRARVNPVVSRSGTLTVAGQSVDIVQSRP